MAHNLTVSQADLLVSEPHYHSWLRTESGHLREVLVTDTIFTNLKTNKGRKFDWVMVTFMSHVHESFVGLQASMCNNAVTDEEFLAHLNEGEACFITSKGESIFLSDILSNRVVNIDTHLSSDLINKDQD